MSILAEAERDRVEAAVVAAGFTSEHMDFARVHVEWVGGFFSRRRVKVTVRTDLSGTQVQELCPGETLDVTIHGRGVVDTP